MRLVSGILRIPILDLLPHSQYNHTQLAYGIDAQMWAARVTVDDVLGNANVLVALVIFGLRRGHAGGRGIPGPCKVHAKPLLEKIELQDATEQRDAKLN